MTNLSELFKPKNKLNKQVSTKITTETLDRLECLARLNNTTVSYIIRIAIDNLLDNYV